LYCLGGLRWRCGRGTGPAVSSGGLSGCGGCVGQSEAIAVLDAAIDVLDAAIDVLDVLDSCASVGGNTMTYTGVQSFVPPPLLYKTNRL
jgi:hypothetical protein